MTDNQKKSISPHGNGAVSTADAFRVMLDLFCHDKIDSADLRILYATSCQQMGKREAARSLGMPVSTLCRRLRRLQLHAAEL
jgi:transcriptional regulator of acetoin/glycerol metabolism